MFSQPPNTAVPARPRKRKLAPENYCLPYRKEPEVSLSPDPFTGKQLQTPVCLWCTLPRVLPLGRTRNTGSPWGAAAPTPSLLPCTFQKKVRFQAGQSILRFARSETQPDPCLVILQGGRRKLILLLRCPLWLCPSSGRVPFERGALGPVLLGSTPSGIPGPLIQRRHLGTAWQGYKSPGQTGYPSRSLQQNLLPTQIKQRQCTYIMCVHVCLCIYIHTYVYAYIPIYTYISIYNRHI